MALPREGGVERERELLQHLKRTTGLTEAVLQKVLDEFQHWYAKDLPTWIRDRHRELQRQGLRNRDIYPRLREEAERTLIRPEPLSERQIRRMIYG